MNAVISEDKEAQRQALQDAMYLLSNIPFFLMNAHVLRRVEIPTTTGQQTHAGWLVSVTMDNVIQTGPDDLTSAYVWYHVWRDEQGAWQTKRVCTGFSIIW